MLTTAFFAPVLQSTLTIWSTPVINVFRKSTIYNEAPSLDHAAGLRVNTWTVDDPDRIRELASWGVDAVITNVPDVARAALG